MLSNAELIFIWHVSFDMIDLITVYNLITIPYSEGIFRWGKIIGGDLDVNMMDICNIAYNKNKISQTW